jgi:hypothetical protein
LQGSSKCFWNGALTLVGSDEHMAENHFRHAGISIVPEYKM